MARTPPFCSCLHSTLASMKGGYPSRITAYRGRAVLADLKAATGDRPDPAAMFHVEQRGSRKKLAQLAGEPGQVLGGLQSSGPVVFRERDGAPQSGKETPLSPAQFQTLKVWSHYSYDGSATVDKIAQPSGKHPFVGAVRRRVLTHPSASRLAKLDI